MPFSFEMNFLIINLVITLLILITFGIKRIFKRHLSPRGQYNLWIPLLISFGIPFLPIKNFGTNPISSWISTIQSSGLNRLALPSLFDSQKAGSHTGWIEDFSVSAAKTEPALIHYLLIGIWISGMFYVAGMLIYTQLTIVKLYKTSLPVQHRDVRRIFSTCKSKVGIKRNLQLRSSAFLKTPVTFGLFKPCIILPLHLLSDFSETDIRFILLHELQHCKRMDSLINYTMSFFHVIYWFHPLVWYTKKELYNDREIACDAAVLHMLKAEQYKDYGFTLLNFAEKISRYPYTTVSGMGGTKSQIYRRIAIIASYRRESWWQRIKSGILLFLTIALVFLCIPFLSVNAASDTYKFTVSNSSYEDLGSYFKNFEGSFVLYSQKEDSFTIYNRKNSTRRISPNSTYKIYSALFGLESKSISLDDTVLNWDGTVYPFDAWNRNQNLNTAMQYSVNWYFQSLDARTGLPALNRYIKQIHYGNEDLSGGVMRYWMESSLKISPIEQVELLSQFYQNELHFSKDSIDAVKNSLFLSSSKGSALYGKTGTGNIENNNINGWFIGFVENSDNTYFFAVNIRQKDNANGKMASKIALNILKDKGIYIP